MTSLLAVSDHVTLRSLLLGAGVAAVGLYAAHQLHRASQLPPGPWGLPILGRLPFIDVRHFEESEDEMRRKYGPIFSFRAGQRLVICVASSDLMKEMLKDEQSAGRLVPPLAVEAARGCGIVFTEGDTWSEQRRVALRVLRDFGFAKSESIDRINEEVSAILDTVEQQPKEVNTFQLFAALSNSVIATLVFGRRYANEDPRFDKFIADMGALFGEGLSSSLPVMFPSFSFILNRGSRPQKVKQASDSLQKFIEEEIADRESQLTDPNAESLCLCDAYIQERRRAEARGDFESHKPFHLVRVCMEMFAAGTDTTARSLEWLLIHMSLHTDIQTKVQEEIDHVVGRQRPPQPSDRSELHYTQAVIDESLRFASLAFNGVPHRALRTFTFRGYRIPDDAMINSFIFGAHRDSSVWERPNDFYPQHFLDQNGHYSPSKGFVPFAVGKRACPGESLAKLEMFMAFTGVMQRFSVQLSSSFRQQVPEILRGRTGTTRIAGENRMDFVQR